MLAGVQPPAQGAEHNCMCVCFGGTGARLAWAVPQVNPGGICPASREYGQQGCELLAGALQVRKSICCGPTKQQCAHACCILPGREVLQLVVCREQGRDVLNAGGCHVPKLGL